MKRKTLLFQGGFPLAVLSALMFTACASEFSEIRTTGTIEATEVRVASEVGGKVLWLSAEEGSAVEEKEVLARIEHEDLDLQLAGARAGVELAEAQLNLLLEGARSEDIRQAEEAVIQAREEAKLAGEDYRRMTELFAGGSVTQKQRDDAEARNTKAQAQLRLAQAALEKLQSLSRPQEVRAARARLAQTEIEVKRLEKKIADCEIRSPMRGVVTQRLAEPGEIVAPGNVLFIISDLSRVYLTVYVSETDLGRITLGQEASVFLDGIPERSFPGRIVHIAEEAEFTPKNVQTEEERTKLVFGVKIAIDNPEGIFKPGLPAEASLNRGGS